MKTGCYVKLFAGSHVFSLNEEIENWIQHLTEKENDVKIINTNLSVIEVKGIDQIRHVIVVTASVTLPKAKVS